MRERERESVCVFERTRGRRKRYRERGRRGRREREKGERVGVRETLNLKNLRSSLNFHAKNLKGRPHKHFKESQS